MNKLTKEKTNPMIERDKVLYFPYINVPQNDWFKQLLLYWDEIGAIVPSDYIYKPEKLNPYMLDLVKAGLVKQIIPETYNMQAGRNFSRAFINLIEKYDISGKARNSRFGPIYSSRIHIEKFGYEISQYLVENKLAFQEEYPWYRVEHTTANLFMSYLASFLGNSDEVNMQPITDDVSNFSAFSQEFAEGRFNSFYDLDRMRIDVLNEILPIPRYIDNAYSIAEFKQKHGDLLPAFRKKIERKLHQISFLSNPRESEYQLKVFKDSLKEEIKELIGRMEDRNWGRIIFGTVCGLGAAAMPGIQAIQEKNWINAWQTIPGLLGAVYAAYDGFASKQQSIISSPVAYAAYIERNSRYY